LPNPGEIWLEHCHYWDDNDNPCSAYVIVLAITSGGDIVYRRASGYTIVPPAGHCFHQAPRPSYRLGHLNGISQTESWLDLTHRDTYNRAAFSQSVADGSVTFKGTLSPDVLCGALACLAGAPDTQLDQQVAIQAQRGLLGCPRA
jgi:hypothetical protein